MTVLLDTLDRLLGAPAVLGAADGLLSGLDGDALPLLVGQARWWERQHAASASQRHNIVAEVRLAGPIDVEKLQDAINDALARHPALRTEFGVHDGKPMQQVQHGAVLSLRFIPKHDEDATVRDDDRAQRIREAAAAFEFDLAAAPLVDAVLLQLGPADHLFVLTCHRLIIDRASIVRLVDEILENYERRAKGREPAEPYATGALADLVAWEQLEACASQPTHSEPLASLDLPTFPREKGGEGPPAKATLAIPVDILDALQRIALELETTVPLVLLAAWVALLDRYTAGGDVVVWVPVASRHPDQAVGMVGCLERRVPIAVSVEEDEVSRLIHRVREIVESTAPEAAFPCPAAIVDGDGGRYQAGFTAGGAPSIVGRGIADCVITAAEIVSSVADCDVELVVQEGVGYLQAAILYDELVLDAVSAARIASHLETLIAGIAVDPHTPTRQIALVTPREEEQQLQEWTAMAEATLRPVHELFEEQVRRAPDAIAVSFAEGQISYRDLNARSNRLAHALRNIGLHPEQLVATLFSTGPDHVTAMLAVLKAGGAFVCLDPAFPRAHVLNILDETEPPLLITDSEALGRIDGLVEWLARARISVVNVDADLPHEAAEQTGYYGQAFIAACSDDDPRRPVAPDARAYIVYTVDSMGRPKGIVQSHRALGQFITWQREEFGIGSQERWAQWGSIAHQASYCAVFGTLCFGATVCMPDEDERSDPSALMDWIRESRVTGLQIPPNFCRQMVEVWRRHLTGDGRHPLPDLRVLVVAGDVLPVDLATSLLEEFPEPPTLYQLYGSSETISATCRRVDRVAFDQPGIPLGRAIRGRQILILDRNQRLCPIGVRGEIYVRSPHLALGYFKRPSETAARFLQNPLHDAYQDPVYRTGDLARWLPDGTLEFSGPAQGPDGAQDESAMHPDRSHT